MGQRTTETRKPPATVSRFSLEVGMTDMDEFRSNHDRSMGQLPDRLARYADAPCLKTDADCRQHRQALPRARTF